MMMDNWMSMSGFGLAHWFLFVAMVAVILYPVGRVLGRLGLSPFWSLLVFIPIVNLIALWVLAFSEWTSDTTKMRS
jgi:NADH:ubiquinone oxidoreductase subunit 3 (subunit A)